MPTLPNPLEEYDNIRKWVYRTYWVVGVVVGAVQVGFWSAGQGTPVPLQVIIGIMAFLGPVLGFQADVNTKPKPSPPQPVPPPPDPGK